MLILLCCSPSFRTIMQSFLESVVCNCCTHNIQVFSLIFLPYGLLKKINKYLENCVTHSLADLCGFLQEVGMRGYKVSKDPRVLGVWCLSFKDKISAFNVCTSLGIVKGFVSQRSFGLMVNKTGLLSSRFILSSETLAGCQFSYSRRKL